jgi:hypothetical protein
MMHIFYPLSLRSVEALLFGRGKGFGAASAEGAAPRIGT